MGQLWAKTQEAKTFNQPVFKQAVTGSRKNWLGINVLNPKMKEELRKIDGTIPIPKGYVKSPVRHSDHITLLYGITPEEFDRLVKLVEEFKLDPSKFTLKYVARPPKPAERPVKEGHPTYAVFVALEHPDLEKFQETLSLQVAKWENKYPHPDSKQDQTPKFRMHLTLFYLEAESAQTPPLPVDSNTILSEFL